MPPRKQPSGAQNRKRKKEKQNIVNSLRGSLNRYFVRNEVNVENCDNVETNDFVDNSNEQDENCDNVETNDFVDNCNEQAENFENVEKDDFVENSEKPNDFNIFDPRVWDDLDLKMKDLLVEKGNLVDLALMQLKIRFEQMQHFESFFGFLFDGSKVVSLLDDELKKCCLQLESKLSNGDDFDIDGNNLFMELQILQVMLPEEAHKGEMPWTSIQIMEFAKKMDMFPNVLVAYKILLTVPVTVASAERSFSKLKLLKSYLRSTMSQERLNGLAIMSIESQFLESLDYHKVIDVFASKTARRHRFR